jgi:hypothetical protein
MHYNACPYCEASPEACLILVKLDIRSCKYQKEESCEEKHKCKEVMLCQVCSSQFIPTKGFLKETKRKIKDG